MTQSVESQWPPLHRAARFALVLLFSAIIITSFASPTGAASPLAATDVAAAPAPGAAGIGDPYFPLLGNGGYDALHYTIDLDLDIEQGTIVTAQTMIRALATQDLSAFNLDFRGPRVDAIAVDGMPADWTRDDGELIVTPAAPIASGQLFVVDVRYHGKPDVGGTDRFERGWWATGDAIFTVGEPAGSDVWYPVNGHPLDKATYTLNVTVPEPFGVVANGKLTSVAMASGVEGRPSTRTFTWENNQPTASYLVMFHAADLDVATSDGPSGIAMTEAFPSEIGDRQRRIFNRVPEMVKFFEELFGPYPFPWLGHTVFEDTALDAALETQGMIGYDASAVHERTVAHEIAHQWFGNSVSPARWQDIWLNEGFARYAEVLWAEHGHGPEAAETALRQQMASFAASTRTDSGKGVRIGDPGPDRLFTEVVYAGGALLLDDLRRRVGDDTFFRILREWATRYRHSNATTDDFIALAEEISGDDLDAFFDDWLYTPWTPERVADRFSLAATPTPYTLSRIQ